MNKAPARPKAARSAMPAAGGWRARCRNAARNRYWAEVLSGAWLAAPGLGVAQALKPVRCLPRRGLRARYRAWKADTASRRWWFRVLLHLRGMIRRPRNIRWHWKHILNELHDRK